MLLCTPLLVVEQWRIGVVYPFQEFNILRGKRRISEKSRVSYLIYSYICVCIQFNIFICICVYTCVYKDGGKPCENYASSKHLNKIKSRLRHKMLRFNQNSIFFTRIAVRYSLIKISSGSIKSDLSYVTITAVCTVAFLYLRLKQKQQQ